MQIISPEVQTFIENMTSPEPEILSELNRKTYLRVLYPRMLSGHYQGRLLSFFSHMLRPTSVLELGTFTGYSCICLAEGLAPEGRIVSIEKNEELKSMILPALEEAGIQDLVEVRFGKAMDIIPELKGSFDLIFIDADKGNYREYYEMLIPRLSSGGVILADNVLWGGKVMDPAEADKETSGIKAMLEFVKEDQRVEQVLLPVRDGILMIRKK